MASSTQSIPSSSAPGRVASNLVILLLLRYKKAGDHLVIRFFAAGKYVSGDLNLARSLLIFASSRSDDGLTIKDQVASQIG